MIISEAFAADLRAFIQKGGHVLAIGQIGIRDENDNYHPEPGPAHMADLLGARIEGGMYLRSHVGPDEALIVGQTATQVEVAVRGTLGGCLVKGVARHWIGDITLHGGTALMSFADEAYRGQPAVVENRTGKGRMLHVAAARLDDGLSEAVLSDALDAAGVRKGPQTPLHVEVVKRGSVTFVINHTASPVTVKLASKGRAVVGRYEEGKAELSAYGVCVVER